MLDLKAWGPTVIEAPPQSLCVVDDFWFRYVADMGIAGPDRGAGGKYLFLPPGYDGEVPDGYFVYRTPTYTNFVVLRALGGVPAMKTTKIYPLSEAAAPATERVHESLRAERSTPFTRTTSASSRRSPNSSARSPSTRSTPNGPASSPSIGIVAGQPFAPDERLKGILEQAALIGAGHRAGAWYTAAGSGCRTLRIVEERLRRRQLRVPPQRRPHPRRPHAVPLPRHRDHSGDGACAGRCRLGVRVHESRRRGRDPRRREVIPPARRRESPGEELLGCRRLRHADPVAHHCAVDDRSGGREQRRRPCARTPTARTTSTSGRPHPTARSRTGSRRCRASRGSRSSASMGRCSRGWIRRGG